MVQNHSCESKTITWPGRLSSRLSKLSRCCPTAGPRPPPSPSRNSSLTPFQPALGPRYAFKSKSSRIRTFWAGLDGASALLLQNFTFDHTQELLVPVTRIRVCICKELWAMDAIATTRSLCLRLLWNASKSMKEEAFLQGFPNLLYHRKSYAKAQEKRYRNTEKTF